jgi:hypothetical protein
VILLVATGERIAGMIGGELYLLGALDRNGADVLLQSCHIRAVADTSVRAGAVAADARMKQS